VHGTPSLDDAVVVRLTDAEGASSVDWASTLAYIGSFEVCRIPLPPGATYTMRAAIRPARLAARAAEFLDGEAGPVITRTCRVRLEYVAGHREFTSIRGDVTMHRTPVLSNELTLTGDFVPFAHPIYQEYEPRIQTLDDIRTDPPSLWDRD
jgi:hypothetical protein